MSFFKILIFLFINLSSFSQSIRFQLFIKSPCKEGTTLAINLNVIPTDEGSYFLKNVSNKKDTQYWNNESGIINLTDTGKYEVHINGNQEANPPVVEIKNTGSYSYTYEKPRIDLRCLGDPGCFYFVCDSLANGYEEDHYKNGIVRLRGNFVEGKVKDSVVSFYSNGIVKKRIRHSNSGYIVNEFDSTSGLEYTFRSFNIKGGRFDEERKEYFSNGKLRLIYSRIKNVVRTKEYFENGNLKFDQTKENRIEYFENGKINVKYSWHFKKDRDNSDDNWGTCKISRLEYDRNGKLIDHQVYEEWGYNITQPKFSIENSDWIDLWLKFKDGVKVFEVEDIDTKKYFEKK